MYKHKPFNVVKENITFNTYNEFNYVCPRVFKYISYVMRVKRHIGNLNDRHVLT